jgi:hypothetical protein
MGKMLVCVYETYLSVTIGDFTFYLSHHVLSCQTTTISTLIQSNHSFLSDKSIPSLHHSLPHSSLHLPYHKKTGSAIPQFFLKKFESTKPPNDSFVHVYPRRPSPGSHHQPCLNGLRSLGPFPPRFARRAFAVSIASSVATVGGKRGPEVQYTYSRSSEMGDRQ